MKRRVLIFLVCFSALQSLVFGQVLENDRFRIAVVDNTIVMTEAGKSRRAFTMDFVVLFNEKAPQLKLRSLSGGPRYTIPTWTAADPAKESTVKAGRGTDHFAVGDGFDPSILKGGTKGRTDDVFQAAPSFWISAKKCSMTAQGLLFSFDEHPLFTFAALLELEPGRAFPKLSFKLNARKDGSYSVGYIGAPSCSLAACDEIWQPLIWQEKRFPQRSHLTLAYRCPVPSAFVMEQGVTTGVVADPKEYPFDPLPLADNSRFGVAVRDMKGEARPMLFAPALGGLKSKMAAGDQYLFSMRLFTAKGDTMKAQELVARELYGFRDVRNNALGSLNRTVDNMTDYILSEYSLFREENKGCNYSTDAPGAVKNVSSIDPLDLSIVMDDQELFERRAYPYMEYMLSRGKFLFTTDENQKTQFPSYRLDGPAAPISELASLYAMFHKATPLFNTLAEQELQNARVRNLDVAEKGATWWNALTVYRTTGEKRHLETAIAGADRYIQQRVETAQNSFNDPDAAGGAMFWTGYAPRYIDLLMLYEATGEQRFLDAAQTGARRYAQYIWMSPAIPAENITVNKGGKAPEYWYLKGKGHKQVLLPEESVPAWRLSAMGLTAESSGTCSGHRAIFMANHAPWMLKIGYLSKDPFLMDIARSAVIGRYRNFPGYHINTARTTAYEKKDFPLCGHKDQSVGSFHYNHILPMLSMLVDYLVTDAAVRSDGQIDFPYNYSEGYAYMQNKAYGAMKGTFFGRDDALLWMPRQLLAVPDQINYVSARGEHDFYMALMNESTEALHADIQLNTRLLPAVSDGAFRVELSTGQALTMVAGKLRVPVAARGLTGVIIKGLKVVPEFQDRIADLDETAAWDNDLVGLKEAAGRAMILNLGTQTRTAYVFLEYSKHDFTKVELVYDDGSGEKSAEDHTFPWEVTVPLSPKAQAFAFRLYGHKPDGSVLAISSAARLKRSASAAEMAAAKKSLASVPVADHQQAEAMGPPSVKISEARASSEYKTFHADQVIDGIVSDGSRWIGEADESGKIWIELQLPFKQKISGAHVYSGFGDTAALEDFHFEFKNGTGQWINIPSSEVSGNKASALKLPFDTTVEVDTDTLRMLVTKCHQDKARVKEIVLWSEGQVFPELGAGLKKSAQQSTHEPQGSEEKISEIYLNQSGFNHGKPKRFTAPTCSNGTAFGIYPAQGGKALFTGTIRGQIGDFSDFNPQDGREYVVKAGNMRSVPFTIGLWQFERISYQAAIDFMVDSRHYTGNYKKKCGGSFGWRDDHHFAWVLRTLVPQYLSNPSAYDRMPKQISYVAPQDGLWGALDAYNEDAPDIVKLIHWGADVTVTQKTSHEFLKGELAFFLYAWPLLQQWLPQQNYDAVLAFVQTTWEKPEKDRNYPYDRSPEHNLLALKTRLGTTKGELPPGHSIMPNLLMYEVAQRDGLTGVDQYFNAAYKQVEWLIRNLDWEDPITTKGQRMSEHITMTSLAAFLQFFPDKAPAGLQKKIQDWANIMVRRSNNMWDFRKLTDDGQWTPSGEKRTMWNEVGNVVGFPAAVLAAAPFVEDPKISARLHELAWSHMDNCFGRNPCGRHFSYDAPREIEGVEHGWYSFHKGGIGKLAEARFVLDGAPKHVHYPYHPEQGNFGWSEGWVSFNTAFNVSLAYMARADTELKADQKNGRLNIRLKAPLNFDSNQRETAMVQVKYHGNIKHVELVEETANSAWLSGSLSNITGPCEISYGYGYLQHRVVVE